MNLAFYPRRRYTEGYTPIQKLTQFSKAIDGPNVYIKRDDLLGLTAGGNKTRKLEYLVAQALIHGADTLITCGAIQSNHCRLTLSAAVKEGLNCRLVLGEKTPNSYNAQASGNILLFRLLGVEDIKVVSMESDMEAAMQEVAAEVELLGRKPYIIPMGGSNEIGATGYVCCAQEILTQFYQLGIGIHSVVCPSASGGTHAGLVAGLYGINSKVRVLGMCVMRPKAEQKRAVHELAVSTAKYVGCRDYIPEDAIECFDACLGPGYGMPTPEMIEAVKLMARTEGILLDPVYTGKTVAGFIDLVRKGYFAKEENVLLLHTGGIPALYACPELF